jgi:ribosomal protein S18 acetylase RimI-like enzyme
LIAVPRQDVTTWYLEATDPAALAATRAPLPGVEIRRAEHPSPELSRGMYAAIGAGWWWVDRLGWDWETWHAHLSRDAVETWLAWLEGTPVGWAELETDGGSTELTYLGLLPGFTGRGIGSRLLDAVLRRGFERSGRVWVHTCSLDGPAALPAYRRRGLRVYDEQTEPVELPEERLEPWPGANRP